MGSIIIRAPSAAHLAGGAILAAACLFAARPSFAGDTRDFCADRPGRGSPPCVLDKGKFQAEMSLVDFTHDTTSGTTDTTITGDVLLRYGVTETTEVMVGWTALGHVRSRDPLTGAVSTGTGTGDVTLGFKTSLHSPDGSGFSVALQPVATVPTGGNTIGSGGWGASLTVPVTLPMPGILQLALSPSLGIAPNSSGGGGHLRYGAVAGIAIPLSPAFNAGVELAAFQDDDPLQHTTKATIDATLAWTPKSLKDIQFDAGAYVGLNRQTPAAEVIVGIAHRF